MTHDFGNSIEDYVFGEPLGKGGFAEVFKANCRISGRVVAIKKISKVNQSHWKRIEEEVKIHQTLKHPSILPLYNAFQDNKYVYLVLELCQCNLLDVLMARDSPFPKEEARSYSRNIIEALQYLQSRGIMHRDLKLTNLLLSIEGDVKLADFGMTTQLKGPEDKHTTMCGTPNYMSPEVVAKNPYGLESDVWSFGCVLYHMLTGYPPFKGKTVPETMKEILHRNFKNIPASVSMDAKDLIERCLQKDRSKRMKLGDILKHRFFSTYENKNTTLDSGVYTASSASSNVSHTNRKNSAISEAEYPIIARKFANGYWRDASPPVKLPISKPCPVQLHPNKNLQKLVGLMHKQTLPNVYEHPVNYKENVEAIQPLRDDFQHCDRSSRSRVRKTNSTDDKLLQRHYSPSYANGHVGEIQQPHIRTHSLDRERQYSPPPQCYSYEDHESKGTINSPYKKRKNHSVSHNNKLYYVPYDEEQNESPIRKSEVVGSSKHELCKKNSLENRCPPLSTIRLRPMHQELDDGSGFFSISENGDFCLKLRKMNGQRSKLVLFKVSQDGRQIWIESAPYDPSYNEKSLCIYGPPSFTYENLPPKHHSKYIYATKLTTGVRAKTAKITYYKEESKYFLMENGPKPNFEALFQSGVRLIFSEDDVIIKDKTNGARSIKNQSSFSKELKELIEDAETGRAFCLDLEDKLSYFDEAKGVFPTIIGRRPSTRSSKLTGRPTSNQSSFSSISNVGRKIGSYEGSLSTMYDVKKINKHSLHRQYEGRHDAKPFLLR